MIGRLAIAFCLVLVATASAWAKQGRYVETGEFLAVAFGAQVPPRQVLWLTPPLREATAEILGHTYRGMRIGYWQRDDKVALVIDEIGKEQPITVGVVVAGGQIGQVQILEFRETRGWEVRYPFFTRQFAGAGLLAERRLDRTIDGITGATLSVRAVTKVAALALYLAGQLSPQQ